MVEAEGEPQPEAEPEAEPEAVAEPAPEAEVGAVAVPDAAAAEPQSEAEPEPELEPQSEAEQEAVAELEAAPGAAPEVEAEAEAGAAEPNAESEPEGNAEPQPAPVPEAGVLDRQPSEDEGLLYPGADGNFTAVERPTICHESCNHSPFVRCSRRTHSTSRGSSQRSAGSVTAEQLPSSPTGPKVTAMQDMLDNAVRPPHHTRPGALHCRSGPLALSWPHGMCQSPALRFLPPFAGAGDPLALAPRGLTACVGVYT